MGSSIFAGGPLDILSEKGPITIENSSVGNSSAPNATVSIQAFNGNNITIDGSNIGASPSTGSIFISALGGTLDLGGNSFISANSISLQARTVYLGDVNFFGNNVRIGSQFGMVGIGPGVGPGLVNIVGNPTYNGFPLFSPTQGDTILVFGSGPGSPRIPLVANGQ
jgi:hypothetical protein